MEKESGVPKPGDLLIGVVDFFAVLIPGIIAAFVIVTVAGVSPKPETFFVSGLIVAGWVLGHVLHGLGSFFDPLLYDRLFKPEDIQTLENQSSAIHKYFHKNDALYRLARQLTDLPGLPGSETKPGAVHVPGGMYQWARAWLKTQSPEATAGLDRLEADSKLFRSLAVLLLIAIPLLIAYPSQFHCFSLSGPATHPDWGLLAFTGFGVIFSVWRYCDLRNKMIRLCYLHYVQLRIESRKTRLSSFFPPAMDRSGGE
jgi:hypothetical protein